MKEFVIILLIALALFVVYLIVKHRLKNKVETITAFTGGLGSGKSFLSSQLVIKLYKKNMFKYRLSYLKYRFFNFFRKKENKKDFGFDKPVVLSNIPLILGFSKDENGKKCPIYSKELKVEHLLLQERIPLGSIVFLDEIGSFANQFAFNQSNIINVFDEFCRLFRHYVSNPILKIHSYMVVNDQCSENINLVIRRRLNVIHNLNNFKLLFKHFCFYFERMICISEEIKTIDMKQEEHESDTQDNKNFKFKFFFNTKIYDTYCYHNRYNRVPIKEIGNYSSLSKDTLLKCPKDKEKLYESYTERRTN